MSAAATSLLLPEGVRLLHIGPPKTGTTTLQAAFHMQREAIKAQGVRYAGRARHSGSAVLAVTGRPSFQRDEGPPPIGKWRDLMREVRRAKESRVVVSSEFFADAEAEAIRRIVADLDPARVHVAVTLRPLPAIVPSQWQQYVQSGLRASFDSWLDAMFNKPPGTMTTTFWRRHRHDQLISRWAEVVGTQNVTVVVVDEADHAWVLRVFEELLGLRDGTLVAERDLANRSMTLPEIEAVRAFTIEFKHAGLGNALFHKVMHFGAAAFMRMREPTPEEPRIETPQWVLDRIGSIAQEIVANIGASGVRVVGDLEALTTVPRSGLAGDSQPNVCVPPEIAASMSMGLLVVSGLARGTSKLGGRGPSRRPIRLGPWIEPPELARFSTCHLVGALAGRARAAAVRSPGSVIRRFAVRQ